LTVALVQQAGQTDYCLAQAGAGGLAAASASGVGTAAAMMAILLMPHS
jgi:hypothetical protein